MSKSPYLDKVQTGRLWAKIKALISPLSSRVDTLETTATETTTDVDELTARVNLLYLKYHTDVTGNNFTVTFTSLDGLVVTGVWNKAEGRLEF